MKLFIGILTAGLALCSAAHAQGSGPGGYPNKPVKIIVPFAPAGPTDIAARLIAAKLTDSLKQQAAPDGYTILFVSSSYVVNPSLYDKVPYDPYKDFRPLTVAATAANVLLVNPKVIPVENAKGLADHVKANPGKYTFASAGTGTTPHLSGELFKLTFKLDTVHVPFGGAGPAIQSIIAGHTPLAFTSLPPAVPHIKAGSLRALAVANRSRVAVLPEVPTLAEAGIPFDVVPGITAALGCAAHAGVPLTHRDHAQTLVFVTGHTKDGEVELDWPTLVRPHQTLVVYMGAKAVGSLCAGLLAHGLDPVTPAALIENGTYQHQRTIAATVATLPGLVPDHRLLGPALIVVGEVVRLRARL